MASKQIDYRPLVDEDPNHFTRKFYQLSSGITNQTLVLLLIFSSIGHFLWPIVWVLHLQYALPNVPNTCGPEKSPYAGLTYDNPVPFRDDSTFLHHNSAVADATWDSWTIEPGIVALPHNFVNKKMLPQAQASPLDKNKGVYVLSSYHSLHCLVSAINLVHLHG